MQNYYVVLGVSKGANLNKIKKAYRTVVKKHHPDVTQSQESKKRFLEIREAYETLSDETKRKQYDESLKRQGSPFRVRNIPDVIQTRSSRLNEMERLKAKLPQNGSKGSSRGWTLSDYRTRNGAVSEVWKIGFLG